MNKHDFCTYQWSSVIIAYLEAGYRTKRVIISQELKVFKDFYNFGQMAGCNPKFQHLQIKISSYPTVRWSVLCEFWFYIILTANIKMWIFVLAKSLLLPQTDDFD